MDFMKRLFGTAKETVKKVVVQASAGAVAASLFFTQPVMASVDSVTQPLANLKTLVISIIGAVGVIILAKNVMEFAQAYQQQDSSSMNSAIKGIVAGLIMAGISSVLAFLGIS
jgi:hypothetical protein